MSNQVLIYSFVARGTVFLTEHTSFSGNFSIIAVQFLQKLPTNSSKYTYSCDGYTFNFLNDIGSSIYSVLCVASNWNQLPIPIIAWMLSAYGFFPLQFFLWLLMKMLGEACLSCFWNEWRMTLSSGMVQE